VTLTKGFAIGQTPVTRGQWERFIGETGYRTESEKGTSGGYGWDGKALVQRKEFTWRNPGFAQTADHPVCIVTYADAIEFCKWLSRKSGQDVTLPSEAQWEYGCRAGATGTWSFGSSEESLQGAANVGDLYGREYLDARWPQMEASLDDGEAIHAAVGRFRANAFGLHDMHGNVQEWCLDGYDSDFYSESPRRDPVAPWDLGLVRSLRGGSYFLLAIRARSACRTSVAVTDVSPDSGVRPARALAD
jgi:formylglycine-generating enzyme required for sulfatase activity